MAGTGPQRPAPQSAGPGLKIARPFGIPVYISPYWFVIAALFVMLYANSAALATSGNARYVVAVAFVVLLYVSVLIHELSHSLVAIGFGLPVRRILLYPLGGFSEIEEEPPTPAKEFLVSAAGPLLSLALAAAGYGLLAGLHPHGLTGLLIKQLVWANLLVGIFNLLPGLPLDGGRILRAAVWKVTGNPGSATVVAGWAGRVLGAGVLAVALVLLSSGRIQIFDAAYFAAIAAFMWVGASQSLRATKVRERLPTLQARTLARRAIPIEASLPLAEAVRRADQAGARALVIVDHDDRPIAIVNEGAVMATPPGRRPWIDAGSLARSLEAGLVLPADLSGMALLEAVKRSPASEYLLVEPSGQVFGVLSATDLDQAFAKA
ncbi:MAG TPA: site-2 protease family protein [Streptosporangiaceae bacterium]|nr:site-2 protease family protein [Streptosporangiaceae bacterium]